MKILHIVHCIDTEGPLKENLKDTFKRLFDIYNIKLNPTKNNLQKIQNKKMVIEFVKYDIVLNFIIGKDKEILHNLIIFQNLNL